MYYIGIDLGTTTSAACVCRNGKWEMIANHRTNKNADITESIIGLDKDTGILEFGERAKNWLITDPDYAVCEFKRLMGTDEKLRLGNKEYSAEELSALLLRYIKEYCEESLNEQITDAVITVPANFNDSERVATKKAGEMAGFNVLRMIHEPTAAALAYGFDNDIFAGRVMIYDLGGGTFDVTILEYHEGVLNVLASRGNTKLGGKDFDEILTKYVAEQFKTQTGVDINDDKTGKMFVRLKQACEDAKKELSASKTTKIDIPFFAIHDNQPIHLNIEITQREFERIIRDKIDETISLVNSTMKEKNLDSQMIDYVLLVGGSSRIPLVRKKIAELFGEDKIKKDIDPDRAISIGAAIQADIILKSKDPTIVDEKSPIILDIMPYALGIATVSEIDGKKVSGLFSEIIPCQSSLLSERSDVFFTAVDNQEIMNIEVYQKASSVNSIWIRDMTPLVSENPEDSQIQGIPPAPAGDESVTVSMMHDLNGVVNVKAILDSTGTQIRFTVNTQKVNEINQGRIDDLWISSENAEIKSIISLAENKLLSLSAADSLELQQLIRDLKRADTANDSLRIEALINQITDFLFERS